MSLRVTNAFPDGMSRFETGVDSYTVVGGTATVTVAQSTDRAHGGSHSLKLTCIDPGDGQILLRFTLGSAITPDVAKTYGFNGYVWCAGRLTSVDWTIRVPTGVSTGDRTDSTDPTHAGVDQWVNLSGLMFPGGHPGGPITGMTISWGLDTPISSFPTGYKLVAGDVAYLDDLLFGPVVTTLPRLRQFPRDDALGGAPRQGRRNGPTSVQGSTRQGWRGTYR